MIKYWKQWRAWVKHRESEREEELLKTVSELIGNVSSTLLMAQIVIDTVRDHRKPW